VSLSDEWRAWVAENLLRGVAREDVASTLCGNGVPAAMAAREVERVARSPLLAGANRIALQLRRHALVTRVRREAAKLGSRPREVERRSGLSPEEFFDRYYAANAPVVVTDTLRGWPALSHWTPSYFKDRFGHVAIEVSTGRDGDPTPDANFKAHLTTMYLAEFCDRVAAAGTSNDIYLVANNRAAQRSPLAPLFEDVRAPHEYLNDRRDGGCVSLWFGPAGTVTPLHHDTINVFFCQVFGRKRVTLFPPSELFLTSDVHQGVYSPVDPERPDLDAFPEFAEASVKEVVISPGEALFIPVGFWHHVRSLEVSISVSFTNFQRPNRFEWFHRGMRDLDDGR